MKRRTENGICEVDYVDSVRVKAARKGLPEDAVLRDSAQAVKAIAHPARLKILLALEGRELCVCDLSQILGLSMSGTSQHLRELRRLDAVEFRTEGKLVYYTLADRFLLTTAESVIEKFGGARKRSGRKRSG